MRVRVKMPVANAPATVHGRGRSPELARTRAAPRVWSSSGDRRLARPRREASRPVAPRAAAPGRPGSTAARRGPQAALRRPPPATSTRRRAPPSLTLRILYRLHAHSEHFMSNSRKTQE
ncbi:unnamed protein product [Euphydryas editha]|uniref:Uncharacterized protein n=1 Tax=Euphydryas editha TaxID=104508 RepID=A0AAU9TLU8_EUPED|nr:unnamed protein product [Euphydryas editha]